MNSLFAVVLFSVVAMVSHLCIAATIDAAALAKVRAVNKMKNCADTSRAVLKDCTKLLATNDKEMKACAQEFTRSFPICFTAAKTSNQSPAQCKSTCWSSYGSCTGYSKGAAEHFTCWNHRVGCAKACDSADAMEKLYARVFVKRTVESCLSTCQGFADACVGQVTAYNDYMVCIISKDTCRSDCYVPAK